MIHSRSNRPGTASKAVRLQKVNQSVWSASQPLPEDSHVRPCAMKDVSKAYCVAVKATLHRPDR